MNEKSNKFNDLLNAEVERRAGLEDGDSEYAAHYLMDDLAFNGDKVVLDGEPVESVYSDGGPGSDMPKWKIVVKWRDDLYLADEWFSSYDLAELGVFQEAESYVEPVTKYRPVTA